MSDEKFVDAESYSGSGGLDKISFQLITLWHVRKIMDLTTQEWHGGRWVTKHMNVSGGVGASQQVYVSDTRESYINAIQGLYDLVFPYFDEKMNIASENYLQDFEKASQTWKDLVDSGKSNDDLLYIHKSKRLNLHRSLFRALGSFLKREKYFGQRIMED